MPPDNPNQTQAPIEDQTLAPPHNANQSYPKIRPLKFLLFLLPLVLAAAIVAIASAHHQPAPKQSAVVPAKAAAIIGQASVYISDSQFTPATIHVKPGTQVTWVNTGAQVHQVAADPYPKDNSIPGFDSTTLLNPHDTLSFVFNKAGTYSYHDEKNGLTMLGKIIVD